jgi:hypothetical protein
MISRATRPNATMADPMANWRLMTTYLERRTVLHT